MNPYVFDANAVLALLRGESGAPVVASLLLDSTNACTDRPDDKPSDLDINKTLLAGINVRDDMDRQFWEPVGQLKVDPGKISLADCFALAIRLGATLVTSDHHEFNRIVPPNLCPILFFR